MYEVPRLIKVAESDNERELEEEHPLEWLQPTPPHSPPMAFYLPLTWKVSIADVLGEATSSTSHDPCAFACMSDTSTTVSEDWDAQLDQGCQDANSRWQSLPLPPQFTPPIPSLSSLTLPAPELPPRVGISPDAKSYSRDYQPRERSVEELPALSFNQFIAGFSIQAHNQELTPMLATADNFSDLSSWSATCEGIVEERKAAGVLQVGGALLSVGSAHHDIGKCRPCAFVHRPIGCADGRACSFCHLCTPGTKKRRQKQKLETIRQRRLQRQVTSASLMEAVAQKRSSLAADEAAPAR